VEVSECTKGGEGGVEQGTLGRSESEQSGDGVDLGWGDGVGVGGDKDVRETFWEETHPTVLVTVV
jgi:hypothetical protein